MIRILWDNEIMTKAQIAHVLDRYRENLKNGAEFKMGRYIYVPHPGEWVSFGYNGDAIMQGWLTRTLACKPERQHGSTMFGYEVRL